MPAHEKNRHARRLSLLARIALALAAVGLLPLLTASWLLARINRDAFEEQVLATHGVAARTAAERVGAYLASLTALEQAVAGNPVLAEPGSTAAQELLAGALVGRPDLGALALVDPAGELVVRAQRRDQAAEMAAVLAKARGLGAGSAEVLAGPETSWLVLTTSLPAGAARLQLVAEAVPLGEAMRGLELASDQAEMVLAAAPDRVLAGTVPSLGEFPPALVAAASTVKISGAGVYPAVDGAKVLGAFAPVPGTSWFVASRQPARLAQSIRLRMQRDSLVAVLLATLLVATLSTAAHSSLVKPIRSLVRAQRELAGLATTSPAGNELDDLRNSFELLSRRVRDREDLGRIFLGRYQVIEQLGAGAMGTVFLGWDPKLQRKVALKTVRIDADAMGMERGELSQKLLREAVTTARFQHPNIVAVYDVESTPEVAFIAMELVDGIGLEWLLWRQRPVGDERSLLLAQAIARALAAAHGQGIVHRDIKPSNVLLGYDGSIKVTDFGIAELMSQVTSGGEAFFGTPGYVPPETLQGQGYTEKSDLFSLGVVLYECLTGVQPFAGSDLRQTLLRTLEVDPPPPHEIEPGVPRELDGVVMQLLAKAPAARPASAEAVVHSLDLLIERRNLEWDASLLPQKGEKGLLETVAHSRLFSTAGLRGRRSQA